MATQAVHSLSAFYSTNLQPQVKGYTRLSDRIAYTLGYPMVNIEVHQNQIYEYISIACEMFSKYAGYTEEWMVFDSNLYTKGKGVRLDKLFAITPELNTSYSPVDLTMDVNNPRTTSTTVSAGVSAIIADWFIDDEDDDPVEYVIKFTDTSTKHTRVSKMLVTSLFNTSAADPLSGGSVTYTEYGIIYTSTTDPLTLTMQTSGASGEYVYMQADSDSTGTALVFVNDFTNTDSTSLTAQQNTLGGYDTLIDNYRKVVDVRGFEEGSTTGVNTLFTIEQTLAQQTYFSFSMGNYGFDLVSWYTVREWLDTREKLLSQRRMFKFNPRTQYLQMLPEPGAERFYGVIECYLEKPLIDLVKEQWVYQYSLALTKIGIGRVRGKYTGTNLFGGGSLDTAILSEGMEEKKALEEQLFTGSAPGMGDSDPPMFFVG
jgi:hypothetical protein